MATLFYTTKIVIPLMSNITIFAQMVSILGLFLFQRVVIELKTESDTIASCCHNKHEAIHSPRVACTMYPRLTKHERKNPLNH